MFDVLGPMLALKSLVEGVPGVQAVHIGVPKMPVPTLVAYVTIGGGTPEEFADGVASWRQRYRVTFAYTVDNRVDPISEENAERALAPILVAFYRAIYAERPRPGESEDGKLLDNTVESIEDPDASGADTPDYVPLISSEIREYPVMIGVRMSENVRA